MDHSLVEEGEVSNVEFVSMDCSDYVLGPNDKASNLDDGLFIVWANGRSTKIAYFTGTLNGKTLEEYFK